MTMAMTMTNTRTTTVTTTINGVNTWFEQVYNCTVVYKAQTRDGKGVTQEDWRELSKAGGFPPDCVSTYAASWKLGPAFELPFRDSPLY